MCRKDTVASILRPKQESVFLLFCSQTTRAKDFGKTLLRHIFLLLLFSILVSHMEHVWVFFGQLQWSLCAPQLEPFCCVYVKWSTPTYGARSALIDLMSRRIYELTQKTNCSIDNLNEQCFLSSEPVCVFCWTLNLFW